MYMQLCKFELGVFNVKITCSKFFLFYFRLNNYQMIKSQVNIQLPIMLKTYRIR